MVIIISIIVIISIFIIILVVPRLVKRLGGAMASRAVQGGGEIVRRISRCDDKLYDGDDGKKEG